VELKPKAKGNYSRAEYSYLHPGNPLARERNAFRIERIDAENISKIEGRIIPSFSWESSDRFLVDIAKSIKGLRESTGMSRKAFSEHTGIPVRTLEDWEAGRRTPPEYIPRLLAYQIKYDEIFAAKGKVKDKRSVSVIKDVDGNNIADCKTF